MIIPKELIHQYAKTLNITEEYVMELIEDSIKQQRFIKRDEAEEIVKQCLEIIIRTVR